MNDVGYLASGIWEDLGSPETPSVTFISGTIGSSRFVGKLNTLLATNFIVDTLGIHSGESKYQIDNSVTGAYVAYDVGDYYPVLNSAEQGIAAKLFEIEYYDKKIRDALNGIVDNISGTMDWSELKEGDSSIKRSNRNEVAKTYRGMQTEAKADLQKYVSYYRENGSLPSQVVGDDA